MQRRGDVVGTDAERHEHHGCIVDGVQQSRHLVVVRAEECCGGRCRVASTTASASTTSPAHATSTSPIPTARGARRGERRRSAHAHAGCRQRSTTTHASVERPESGGPSGRAGTRLARPHEAPAALGGCEQGGTWRRGHVSTEPAWIPPISGSTSMSTTRCPSLRATSGRGTVADRPRTSGRGSTASRARPRSPRTPTMPERAVARTVGMPSAWPRAARAAAASPHRRTPGRDGHKAVAIPTSPHRSTASRRRRGTRRDPGRPCVPEVLALQGATTRGDASKMVTAGAPARGVAHRSAPCRAQTTDAAADDDDAARRHLRALHRWR